VVELLLTEDRRIRRTRVVHVQTQTEERWPSWDGTRLLNFIIAHVGSPASE
jgi:hypothetical protein